MAPAATGPDPRAAAKEVRPPVWLAGNRRRPTPEGPSETPFYRPAPSDSGRLAERLPLSEAELSLIWAGQRFPPEALATVDGRRVRVLFPGRLNGGAGPDFRDAVFELAGQRVRGDVELHLRASSFRAHGHHVDPAYTRLALHVVYLADEGCQTLLSDGSSVPVAAFAPWVERRAADLRSWLTAPPMWREPCSEARSRLGDAGVAAALEEAGMQRFVAKLDAFAETAAQLGEEEALWRALLSALGAGGDRAGFQRLAAAFSAAQARAVLAAAPSGQELAALEDALLWAAGLAVLARPRGLALPRPLAPPLARGARPANRPEHRLRALARLFLRAEGSLASWARRLVAGAEDARELRDALRVAGTSGQPALLGEDRAGELLVNALLPAAAQEAALRERAQELLSALPPPAPYGKTRFLEQNLRPAGRRRPVSSALQQQGLLQLLANWCSQGGCGSCPLS